MNIFSTLSKFRYCEIDPKELKGTEIKTITFIIKKKKNHLGKKVTTIKFWDKKWRVFWRISSKLGKVWYLGRFSFLPSLGNRKKCAGGKDEVYNVLPTFSHVFPGENTGYNGEGRSRAQWRGSRVRATVYRYSFIIGRWKIVVSPIRL